MPSSENIGAYLGLGTGYRLSIPGWQQEIALAAPLGLGFVRGNFDVWDLYQPSSGTFDFAKLDQIINTLGGLRLFLTLPISASWNRGAVGCPGTYALTGSQVGCTAWPTQDPEDLLELAFMIANRYKGVIKHYEVWNEPDFGQFWKAEQDPVADDYLPLLRAGYEGIKSIDSDATVMMGGLAFPQEPPNPLRPGWFDRFIELGGLNYTDKINVHIYPAFASFPQTIARMRGRLQRAGVKKGIWITETSSTGGRFETSNIEAEEYEKAVWLVKNYTWAFTNPDVEKIFWHTLRIQAPYDFALMAEDGTPKPAYTAHQTWSRLLLPSQFVSSDITGNVRNIMYKNDNVYTNVIWTESGTVDVVIPQERGLIAPKRITMLGEESSLTRGQVVQVGTEPVYITYYRLGLGKTGIQLQKSGKVEAASLDSKI